MLVMIPDFHPADLGNCKMENHQNMIKFNASEALLTAPFCGAGYHGEQLGYGVRTNWLCMNPCGVGWNVILGGSNSWKLASTAGQCLRNPLLLMAGTYLLNLRAFITFARTIVI